MFQLKYLPPQKEIETPAVLRQVAKAHWYLAELKGVAKTIPNEQILINMLSLQEAKASSEIENIVTTHDDLYRENIFIETKNPASKEEFLARDLQMTERTAQNYLDEIAEIELLEKIKVGNANYYMNNNLIKALMGEK